MFTPKFTHDTEKTLFGSLLVITLAMMTAGQFF